jgi:chromosome segregation ATPase
LYQELYILEATAHASAAQRAEQKIVALEQRNRQLAAFLEEREAFLQRVKKALEELKCEERRLREQYAGILAEVTLDASPIEVR